jgi:hypothetical protein
VDLPLWTEPIPHPQGARHDRPHAPVRERSSKCRQEGTIIRTEPWTIALASHHRELVPQHNQLDVFSELAPTAPNEQLQDG